MTVDELKSQLAALKARYDSGAVSPQIYKAIRQLEHELAWRQHEEQRHDR